MLFVNVTFMIFKCFLPSKTFFTKGTFKISLTNLVMILYRAEFMFLVFVIVTLKSTVAQLQISQ